MTRKPAAKVMLDKSMGIKKSSGDVKGMPSISITVAGGKPPVVKHTAGAKHGIINLGQPPKKFPVKVKGGV